MTAAAPDAEKMITVGDRLVPISQIAGFECRHVIESMHPNGIDDLHLVKEYVHFKDGTKESNLRFLYNHPRSFWITKPGFRNHKDKKEYEELERLQEYKTNQAKLPDKISRALTGRPVGRDRLRDLAKSPYLYGCDIQMSSLIKKAYQDKYPKCVSPSASVAVFDIETDVVNGTGEVIVATLSFKDRCFTAVSGRFIKDGLDTEAVLQKMAQKHLGETLQKRGTKIEFALVPDGVEAIVQCFKKAHEWRPDFVVVWNINYDIPFCVKKLEDAGVDPAQVFSDPSVPEEYRYFKYREGPKMKVTQSGKKTPLSPAERWHTADCPASFYLIDAMCLYYSLRIAKGKEPSYSLDAVLNKHIGLGKLSLPEVDHLDGLDWHKEMQRNHRYFYVIYNVFDCIGVELLDDKNGDVARQFPILCGISDYGLFKRNPRRIVDDLHFFYMDRGKVIGSTGSEVEDENDSHVVGLRGWIVTLPANLVVNNGAAIILGLENIRSMLRYHLADLDIEGTYPTNQVVMNISKKTTLMEVVEIRGIPEATTRKIGINISGGVSNSVEICSQVYGLPTLSEWIPLAQEHMKRAA